MMREHGAGERRDLRKPYGRPIQRTPRHGLGRDSRTHAAEYHSRIVTRIGASLAGFGGNVDELLNGGAVACVKVLLPRTHRTAVRRVSPSRIRRRQRGSERSHLKMIAFKSSISIQSRRCSLLHLLLKLKTPRLHRPRRHFSGTSKKGALGCSLCSRILPGSSS
jgi:hypothetical protein